MLIIINPNTIQIVYSYSPVLHKYYGIINILQYYTNSKLMYKYPGCLQIMSSYNYKLVLHE